MLRVLPHRWSQWRDTRLEEAVFVRHKEGKGAMKHQLAHDSPGGEGQGTGRGVQACWR